MKIIIDLDGCICDDRHRLPLLDKGWTAYHEACPHDRPMNLGCLQFWCNCEPVIITGRPVRYQDATLAWLSVHTDLDNFELHMRPENCVLPSPLFKKDVLLKIANPAHVLCAFDDREDVLKMYQELGIRTVRTTYDTTNAPPSLSIPDLLRAGAMTFEERNAVYGETYEAFGHVMASMFPDGLHINREEVNKFNRLGVYIQIVTKICRYATSFKGSGHVDSAHDAMVYSAMLEYLTRK